MLTGVYILEFKFVFSLRILSSPNMENIAPFITDLVVDVDQEQRNEGSSREVELVRCVSSETGRSATRTLVVRVTPVHKKITVQTIQSCLGTR